MKIVLASRNKHKISELQALLREHIPDVEILSLDDVGFYGDIVEDGETFLENAGKKAREIAEISGCAALADDSGICVHALGGAPGIYSARYSGGHGNDLDNNNLVLKNLKDKEDKSAHYTCAVVLAYPDGREISAEGYMYGEITEDSRGDRGFGYDPIFVPEGESRTVAEMTDEEKNAISHRANALRLLLEKI